MSSQYHGLNILQKISMSLMGVLVLITFVGANLHTLLWQSSDWLVSAVLPSTVVQLTNEERIDNSVKPLTRSAVLDEAARLKAEDMAKHEYFSHFSPSGVSPWHWFDKSGYVFAHAGENLAIHFTDSSEVVDAWMLSPKHRENIVSGLYTEIGVGTAKGKFEGYDTVYVVQLFGTPAYVPTTKIKSEPLTTATPKEVLVQNTENDIPVEVLVTEDSPALATEIASSDADIKLEETQNVGLTAGDEIVTQSLLGTEIIETKVAKTVQTEGSTLVDKAPRDLDNSGIVVVESQPITISSGLPVAEAVISKNVSHAGETLASIATQPNELLQILYTVLAVLIVSMLSISVVMEVRRFHFHQVAYGLILLTGMSGLWYAHSLLTTGAVIV